MSVSVKMLVHHSIGIHTHYPPFTHIDFRDVMVWLRLLYIVNVQCTLYSTYFNFPFIPSHFANYHHKHYVIKTFLIHRVKGVKSFICMLYDIRITWLTETCNVELNCILLHNTFAHYVDTTRQFIFYIPHNS